MLCPRTCGQLSKRPTLPTQSCHFSRIQQRILSPTTFFFVKNHCEFKKVKRTSSRSSWYWWKVPFTAGNRHAHLDTPLVVRFQPLFDYSYLSTKFGCIECKKKKTTTHEACHCKCFIRRLRIALQRGVAVRTASGPYLRS